MVTILGRRIELGPLLAGFDPLAQSYDLERAPNPLLSGMLSEFESGITERPRVVVVLTVPRRRYFPLEEIH